MTSYQSIAIESYNNENHERTSNGSSLLSGRRIASTVLIGMSFSLAVGYFLSINNLNIFTLEDELKPTYDESIDKLPIETERNDKSFILEKPYNLDLITSSPSDLTYLNNPSAFQLLMDPSTSNYHYFLYESGLDAQINQSYCAVATSVALLNSLRYHHDFDMPMDRIYAPYPYATQNDVFNECTEESVIRATKEYNGVRNFPGGLGLDQTVNLLNCHVNRDVNGGTWTVEGRHVDPDVWTVDLMRNEIIDVLNNPDGRVAINYNRAALGQVGGGHFSPIGAHNPKTDSFLILDVAKYKYPHVWVSATKLFNSMATLDTCGTWNYPQAQELVTATMTITEKMNILGCKSVFRGYVIVKKTN